VKANLNSDEAFRDRLSIDLKDFVEGSMPIDVTYTEHHEGRAVAEVRGDLGPARFFIGPFQYVKEPGIDGAVTLKAEFKDGDIQRVTELEVVAPELSLAKGNLLFRSSKDKGQELAGGAIGDFVINESKGSMTFTVEESGRHVIKADASVLDLRPFVKRDNRPRKPYDNPPMLIEAKAAEIIGAHDKKLSPGRFLIDLDKDGIYNRMEVDADTGGPMALRLGPDENGVRRFSLDAENAGATLTAFGVYKNMRGGKISIHGKASAPGQNDMAGKAQITDFTVANAPVLAHLIGALSLPGLVSLLNGEGLGFSKLEADYTWNSRTAGSVLKIKDGRTSGNSVGFSFEGDLNFENSTLDISGTMVPLSDINKIIKSIPLVGDILTGGSGLIAATYSVKGPTDNPSVMVNPLSVLTPGILRTILFE
jgi:hypothetical protein